MDTANTARSSQESVLQPQSDPYIKSETSIKIPLFTAKAAPKVLMYVSQLGNPSKKVWNFPHLVRPHPPRHPLWQKVRKIFEIFFSSGVPPKKHGLKWLKMA